MANIHIYDSSDEERGILEHGLTGHFLTFYPAPITIGIVSPDAEIISIFVSSTVTIEMLDKMPNLKLIACRSAGYNNVPIYEAEKRGIHIVVVPSYGESTVAEYTFSLLLLLTRKINESVKAIKENMFFDPVKLRGIDLFGKKIGVIGTGRIGKRLISIAKGFGMDVIAYDAYENETAAHMFGFTYVSKEELFKQSDIISLHAPLTDGTRHILNEEAFSLMKDSVYIINTARGELIDTGALLVALNNNKIAGVGLDVVEGEEFIKENPVDVKENVEESAKLLRYSSNISLLIKDDRVLLTPHVAYNTHEAVARIIETTIQNIRDYGNGVITNKVTVDLTQNT